MNDANIKIIYFKLLKINKQVNPLFYEKCWSKFISVKWLNFKFTEKL